MLCILHLLPLAPVKRAAPTAASTLSARFLRLLVLLIRDVHWIQVRARLLIRILHAQPNLLLLDVHRHYLDPHLLVYCKLVCNFNTLATRRHMTDLREVAQAPLARKPFELHKRTEVGHASDSASQHGANRRWVENVAAFSPRALFALHAPRSVRMWLPAAEALVLGGIHVRPAPRARPVSLPSFIFHVPAGLCV